MSNPAITHATSQGVEPKIRNRSELIQAVSKMHSIAVERRCTDMQRYAIGNSVILFVTGSLGRLSRTIVQIEHKELPTQENAWRSEFSVRIDDAAELSVTMVETGFALNKPEGYPAKHKFRTARSHALMRLGESDRRIAVNAAQSGRDPLRAEVDQCNGLTLSILRELYCLSEASEYTNALATREVRGYRIHKFCEPSPGQSLHLHTEVFRDLPKNSTTLCLRSSVHVASSSEVVAISETLFR
ncbi:MAG: hypothetical protein AAFR68_14915 [Pseudomonadota bacterium]